MRAERRGHARDMRCPRVAAAAVALLLAAPARTAEPRTPTEVAAAFFDALHRHDAERAAALATGPEARRTLRAFVKLSRAYADLEEALVARFGPEAGEAIGYRARVRAEAMAFLAARDEVEGDRAQVRGGDDRLIAVLRRVKGVWRVDLADALNLESGVAALEREAGAARRAADAVVRGVAAGRYPGPDEALDDFRERLARAVEAAPRPGERSF